MEPNVAAVFQTHRNTNGTINLPDKKVEEKSTIDKVFEDLESETESNDLKVGLKNHMIEKTLDCTETNGYVRKDLELGETSLRSVVTDLNELQEPFNGVKTSSSNVVTNLNEPQEPHNGFVKKGLDLEKTSLRSVVTDLTKPEERHNGVKTSLRSVVTDLNELQEPHNGFVKKGLDLEKTSLRSVVTDLNRPQEPHNGVDITNNLMLHIDIAKQNESIKTKDGIELADLLEAIDEKRVDTQSVMTEIPNSLLDRSETTMEMCDTNVHGKVERLKTDDSFDLSEHTVVGELSRSFDLDGLSSTPLNAMSQHILVSNLVSVTSNTVNSTSNNPYDFPTDGLSSSTSLNAMSQQNVVSNILNVTSNAVNSAANIPYDFPTDISSAQQDVFPPSTIASTSGTHAHDSPSGTSPFGDIMSTLGSRAVSYSPRTDLYQLHSLESEPNSLEGRYAYDDGLNESAYQNVDYSSGDFSNVVQEDLLSKYKQMEAQQEMLNRSLMSLSTHFAQVQLRLKQIINSPKQEQEALLKNLEKFTFIGIPEVNELCLYNYETNVEETVETAECKTYIEDKLAFEKNKHKEMIGKLKTQLESLENYVYEFSNNDDAEIPTSLIINKQQIIINELKDKLNLNVNLSEEEQLREEINKSIIGPMKTKEDLILQLKTQISDLEKFINFLQSTQCKCTVGAANVDMKHKTITIMKKISTILHIFAEHHSSNFKKPTTAAAMKKSMKVNHYGDLRAQLEIAVNHVIDACRQPPDQELPIDSDYMSDTEDPIPCNSKVALAVRKHLAPTLQRLLQHGLSSPNSNQTVSVVQYISCASSVNKHHSAAHIWDLISKYYELKDGPDFNCKPNRKLSESFNLDIGSGTLGIKQSLLASIGNILAVHHKYKKYNPDSYFKSFVCDGLNKKLLVEWLHVILTYKTFVPEFYTPWSYVATTRFTDAAASLRRLYEFHFSLTIVDVAIRNLQSIKDAF